MTFLEIDKRIEELFEKNVDQETGEIIAPDEGEFLAMLDQFYDMKNEKIENMVKAYRFYTHMEEALKKEKQAIEQRQKVAKNRAESIKNFLSVICAGEKYNEPSFQIGYRKSDECVIECEVTSLPSEFQEVTVKAKVADLKKFVKAGNTIEGVSIIEKQNIQIK